MYYMDEGQIRVSWVGGRCPECGGPPDERVEAGMKCGRCAYAAERRGARWDV